MTNKRTGNSNGKCNGKANGNGKRRSFDCVAHKVP